MYYLGRNEDPEWNVPVNKEYVVSCSKIICSQDVLQNYGYLYDLSRSEREKIHDQAVTMCIDGQPLDMIQQLIQVAVGDLGLSPKDIVQCAIKKIVCTLR